MSSPATSSLRLGVVGCARILPAHLRGIARLQAAGFDPVRITALCARRLDDARMFRRRGEGPNPRPPASGNESDPLGAPHRYASDLHPDLLAEVFDDWRAMLAADVVDAVLILAPVHLHHEIAIDALRAGKHVLIEKPLAITVRAARAIVTTAAEHGLVAGVAETQRFQPRTRALQWVIGQGLIGTPQLYLSGGIGGEWAPDRIVAHTPWRHRKLEGGGGPALDHGVHLMSQIRYLMGPIDDVSALTKVLEPVRRDPIGSSGPDEQIANEPVVNELEDVFLAQFRFTDGAIGCAFSGWGGRGAPTGIDANPVVYGDAGCIKGDAVFADDGLVGQAGDMMRDGASADVLERFFPRGVRDPFGLELLDFTRAIAAGSAMETSADEGLEDLTAAYAILESAVARGRVPVSAVRDGTVSAYQAEIDAHYGL